MDCGRCRNASGKIDQLDNVIQGGLGGMRGMDDSLRKLLDARMITGQTAYEAYCVKSKFHRYADATGYQARPMADE